MSEKLRAMLSAYAPSGSSEREELGRFGKALHLRGVELVASGGTAGTLREYGCEVISVEEVTGSPEMLGGRVKTIHPKIAGALLFDPNKPEHVDDLEEHGIVPIDILFVVMYPLEQALAEYQRDPSSSSLDEVLEKADMGGQLLLRSGGKASPRVIIGSSFDDCQSMLDIIDGDPSDPGNLVQRLRLIRESGWRVHSHVNAEAELHGIRWAEAVSKP